MNKGLWIWPADPRNQRRVLRLVAGSPHLTASLQGIARNKEGMSNPELDELLADNSNWITLWTVRQLLAMGFIEYRVDLFGGPAKYVATDLGRNVLSFIAGQPASQPPPAAVPHPQTKPPVAGPQAPPAGAPDPASARPAQPSKP